MMIHRYWCGRCRNVTTETSEVRQNPTGTRTCEKCNSIASYLESVAAPVADPNDATEPTAANPRKPPSREEWIDAGMPAEIYERRFSGPEWGPCWSDPNYVPKHKIASKDDETEQTPDVDDT